LLDSFGIPALSKPVDIYPKELFSKVKSVKVPARKLAKSNPYLVATVLSIMKYGRLFREMFI
jgi:hypothetical protein